jgi:hypothetical protein
MFMFGDTDDVFEYWSASPLTKGAQFKHFISELYLTYSFRKRKGWSAPNSIEAVWKAYRDYIIVVNWNDLDILWLKYEYFWENLFTRNERYQQLSMAHKFVDLSFNEWFNIFSNAEHKVISSIEREKFAHFLETVNFSDYERNYDEAKH